MEGGLGEVDKQQAEMETWADRFYQNKKVQNVVKSSNLLSKVKTKIKLKGFNLGEGAKDKEGEGSPAAASAEEAKMDLEYLNQQDYYYPNQTFLPNVSPSASSLDSGYCGPASVQSSVESPHNLGKVK